MKRDLGEFVVDIEISRGNEWDEGCWDRIYACIQTGLGDRLVYEIQTSLESSLEPSLSSSLNARLNTDLCTRAKNNET